MQKTARSANPRSPLTRERVLRAALELADDEGIEKLSMRKLGQRLSVEAMSIYNHVSNKDDLLDGIVDLVLAEIELPSADLDWKAAIRRTAISSHETFLRHPWACGQLMRGMRVSPRRLEWMEGVLRTFREAGFSANLTHHAYHAIDSHVTGFTLWQVNMPFDTREELVDLAQQVLPTIPAETYPYVVEHAYEHLEPSNPEGRTEFEFGLDLILDGLENAAELGSLP
jgi:AcrR family transcriptional regulator